MNKLLTATLLFASGAAMNLSACRTCDKADKPKCYKDVTVREYTCPKKHTVYSCPEGYERKGAKESHKGKGNNKKPKNY